MVRRNHDLLVLSSLSQEARLAVTRDRSPVVLVLVLLRLRVSAVRVPLQVLEV